MENLPVRKSVRFALLFVPLLASAVVFAQSSPQPGAPGIGDPLYPNFGNGGYDVQHYTLDLTVDPKSDTLNGDVTINANATQDLSRFDLDLIGFQVTSITIDNAAATFTRAGQELIITPAAALANGNAFSVEVRYGTAHPRVCAQSRCRCRLAGLLMTTAQTARAATSSASRMARRTGFRSTITGSTKRPIP